MSETLPTTARALGWWRRHVSLQFGLACLVVKLGTELLGLDWTGPAGFLHAANPAADFLLFFPACVIAFDLVTRLPGFARVLGLGAIVLAIAAASVADLLTLEFLHENVITILPILLKMHALAATGSNRFELIPGAVLALAAAFAVGAFFAFRRKREPATGFLGPAFLLLVGYLASANRDTVLQASLNPVTGDALDYTDGANAKLGDKPLPTGPHAAPEIRTVPSFAPSTIIVFINESLPWHFASSEDPHRTLFDTILGESGLDPADWHVFTRAFTNASATDISMPSILTGADPTAGTEEVGALPFLYAMAKRRGYATGFFTSQDYVLANLRGFFASDQLDVFLFSELTGQPSANIGGIDDIYIAKKVADHIRAKGPGGKIFLVVNNNALHVPYQIESIIAVPGYANQAKQRAAYIIEQFYGLIFRSLEDTGRLKDSLIFVTSDHGESHPDRKRAATRLYSHYDEVINIPFAIHLPAAAPAAFRARLAANRDRTVENLDIAPTLMDALGLGLPRGLNYPGFDLFGTIPEGRVSISVTNNEWSQWRPMAFGLACGDDRLIFHQKFGLMYYDVRSDPEERRPITRGSKFDSYRAFAMVHPALPKYLSGAGAD